MARANNEVTASYEVVVTRSTHCKGTIREGRFAGRRCGNASPCMEHDVMPVAYNLQAQGPDEYPLGFYIEMAKQRLAFRALPPQPKRTVSRWSVLR